MYAVLLSIYFYVLRKEEAMIEQELLKQYEIEYQKLLEFGFKKEKDSYIFKKELNSDLYVIFLIQCKTLKIDVYEKLTNEKYLPFYIKEGEGSYSKELKEKIETIKKECMKTCFQSINIKEQILSYVRKKYQTEPEYPWIKFPDYFTLKTSKSQKWYGLVMNISIERLGVKRDYMVDAMNLKNIPDKIQSLIDYKTVFPAHHMNKKYWITILLNKETDMELLKQLIDESYQLVEK
jgi:predicted DNA-binding protein (MmcQ/YjbR family)